MADIEMRFDRDMLVLSSPVSNVLARQGIDIEKDGEFVNLIEPDTVHDAMRLEIVAGVQCLVANTKGMLPARLMHQSMEDRGEDLAVAALTVVSSLKPQHILVELGTSGLPFDATSKSSLVEHKDQYKRAASWFEPGTFDAYFLNGFDRVDELKCALMGIRQVSDRSIFSSVKVDGQGFTSRGETLEQACAVMAEYGASVVGFSSAAPIDAACALVQRAVASCDLPVLAELIVGQPNPKQGGPTDENPYYCPDVLVDAAVLLHRCGVQFLRAGGLATPAYSGALSIAISGLDVVRSE